MNSVNDFFLRLRQSFTGDTVRRLYTGNSINQKIRTIYKSPVFDHIYYSNNRKINFKTRKIAVKDYISSGYREGVSPHPLFDISWYLSNNNDVAQQKSDPLFHFLQYGGSEGRAPSADFDSAWYLTSYPDVAAAAVNPLEHYLKHGAGEGRCPSARFDSRFYIRNYPDVAAAGINPLVHFVMHGRREGRVPRRQSTYKLDEDYSMTAADFLEWRQIRCSKYLDASERSYDRPVLQSSSKSEQMSVVIVLDFGRRMPSGYCGSLESEMGCANFVLPPGWHLQSIIQPNDVNEISKINSDYFLFLGAEDQLDKLGMRCLFTALDSGKSILVFDTYFEKDQRYFPVLQPGFNRLHFSRVDSVFSRFALRGDVLSKILAQSCPTSAWGILRQSLALDMVRTAGAVEHLAVPTMKISTDLDSISTMRRQSLSKLYKSQTAPSFLQDKSITVVICTKDKGFLLNALICSIFESYRRYIEKIVVVSNSTSNANALNNLERWRTDPDVTVVAYNKKFNFSDQTNIGIAVGKGAFVLLINDDVIPLSDGWLFDLISHLEDPSVGAVGPLLLYPNETVQHAGMHMGFDGSAGHSMRGAVMPEGTYLFHATHAREVTCVTGAVLLTRRSIIEALNGLDIQLATIFQDVDLCLRIGSLGHKIVLEPASILLHMESVSLKDTLHLPSVVEGRNIEYRYFVSRHGENRLNSDRFINPSFVLEDENLRSVS